MATQDTEATHPAAQHGQTELLAQLACCAIEGLSSCVAILDPAGDIVATNRAWNESATSHALIDPPVSLASLGVGANYLTACERASSACADARLFAAGIRAVMAGATPIYELEYSCRLPAETRWYTGRVTRFSAEDTCYALVAHDDITASKLAADQLSEREQTLRSIYDSAPMVAGIVERVGDDLLNISGNIDAAHYYGVTREALQHRFASALGMPPADLALWVRLCRESEETGKPARFVFPYRAADKMLWVAGTVCFIGRAAGGHPRFSYIAQDITEQINTEQNLRLSAAIMNESSSGIVITDHRERILYVNPAFVLLSGYTLEELRGKRPGQVLQGDRADRQQQRYVRESLRARKPLSVEMLSYYKSGASYWVEMHVAPVFNDADEVTHFVAVVNDITPRKRTEDAIRKSQAQLEEAEHMAHIGSWEYDLATKRAIWSKELFRLHERDPELGAPDLEEYLALFPPDEAARLRELTEHAVKNNSGYELDVRRIAPDGSIRWFHCIRTTHLDRDGNAIFAVGTVHDITQRKEAEQELARLHNRLMQAREAETAISAQIQNLLLVPAVPQKLPGVQIASLSLPSPLMDGDFSDFVVHSDTLFDLLMGDVMGKGLSTALLGAASKSLILRGFIYLLGSEGTAGMPSPEALIRQVHKTYTPRLLQLETFITAAYIRFDMARHEALLVDCGYTSPIHYRAETDECEFVRGDGLPLGVSASERYRQIGIPFLPGDMFVFYSDGIAHAQSPTGQRYGEERLRAVIQEHRHEPPEQLIASLHRSLREFTSAHSFTDDVTCIVVKITTRHDP